MPVATILDVGVLTGTPELIRAFPDLHHVLFEPVEEFRPAIEATYAGVDHRLVPAAVSDADGQITLQVSSNVTGVPISHSGMVEGGVSRDDQRAVPMITLDDYLARNPISGPYLLKIDIDGEELRVLKGASATLMQTNILIMEMSLGTLVDRLTAAEAHDFVLFDLSEPCYYDDAFWQCDAILIRRSIKSSHFRSIGVDFDPACYSVFDG